VLQNQTTISNAYVGLGPFRSEFFLTPAQNSFELGSLPGLISWRFTNSGMCSNTTILTWDFPDIAHPFWPGWAGLPIM
jgi:hypothetical protein